MKTDVSNALRIVEIVGIDTNHDHNAQFSNF